MPSSHSPSTRHSAAPARRYRRSAFNGAKQLEAAGAQHRHMLWVLGALALALVVALVVVAMHLAGGGS